MCIINKLNTTKIIWTDLIIIFIVSALNFVFGYSRKRPDFNTYDLFNSSPFFNFLEYGINNKYNVFHTWGGMKYGVDPLPNLVYGATNITRINSQYFIYKYISYIDLLNNGQIIKKGTECPKEYNKNCGRIDTLNQELCIKENEKCPLYDVGIGLPPENFSYIYNKYSNIYYNKDNYSYANKVIIGKLILNDGQPCYQPNEKLWRAFSPLEVEQTHLKCKNIQIFEKYNDYRYIEKGKITYKKLYEDNYINYIVPNITNNISNKDTVHLYKREFYGIDKKCNEKLKLTDSFNIFSKIQKIDSIIQVLEGIIFGIGSFLLMILELAYNKKDHREDYQIKYFILFIIYIIVISGCFSFHFIAFINILKNDYSYYNCSDSLTNEIIKIGNKNNNKLIIYNVIGTFPDGIIIAGNLIVLVHAIIRDKIDKNKENKKNKNDNNQNSEKNKAPDYASDKYKINNSLLDTD